MKILSEIIKKEPENKPAILSAVGRLYLQVSFLVLMYKFCIFMLMLFIRNFHSCIHEQNHVF